MILRKFLPSLILLALCALLPSRMLSCHDNHLSDLLFFHFTHANIFHLLANACALYLLLPRWKTALIAYISATLAAALLYIAVPALIPATVPAALAAVFTPSLPTCGLSAIICAGFARPYASWHKPILPFILAQALFIPFANFNYQLHILSFLIAYLIWKQRYK